MSLALQVVVGAALGFVFIWALTVVGTRITERRRDAAISARQARVEINAIRRQTIRQLFDISNGRGGSGPPVRFRGRFLDQGDDEP